MNKNLIELCNFTKYLAKKGLISGSEGNLSIRDKYGFWITPSGRIKELLKPADFCFINWKGEVIKGNPSIEWGMHYKIYLKNHSVNAIVHTHPLYTLLLDFSGFKFKEFEFPEAEFILKEIAVMPYFQPGSEALWEFSSNLARSYKIIILSKHGAITCGKTLEEAVNLSLILEKISQLEYFKNRR